MLRKLLMISLVISLGFASLTANATPTKDIKNNTEKSIDIIVELNSHRIDARDLKTLHYMENAHGQLEQWSLRLLSRLENAMGPRKKEPILDGRADLQVQKIAITYASYTHNEALSKTLKNLAKAHRMRLMALQNMVIQGADRRKFEDLSLPVTELVAELRTWSKRR